MVFLVCAASWLSPVDYNGPTATNPGTLWVPRCATSQIGREFPWSWLVRSRVQGQVRPARLRRQSSAPHSFPDQGPFRLPHRGALPAGDRISKRPEAPQCNPIPGLVYGPGDASANSVHGVDGRELDQLPGAARGPSPSPSPRAGGHWSRRGTGSLPPSSP